MGAGGRAGVELGRAAIRQAWGESGTQQVEGVWRGKAIRGRGRGRGRGRPVG